MAIAGRDRERSTLRSCWPCLGEVFLTAALASACTHGDRSGPFPPTGDRTPAHGDTYLVGPTRAIRTLQEVAPQLGPGDLVLVDGAAAYPGDLVFIRPGQPNRPITIRGVAAPGQRPQIRGGRNTVEFRANHYVFENFDVSGGSTRCVFHHAHDIVIRDSLIHDCNMHGLLGADEDSGSLLLEAVEVFDCGGGDRHHCIYMATDESAYPGAVFRMQQSYVHSPRGGNAVKSRAERNEIYYNWIEGALYHELELIGPDGQPEELAREDSDVVGNVFVKRNGFSVTRIGGDGTGETHARYRFVNNTFVVLPKGGSVFRLFDGLECVEMHNNALIALGGGTVEVMMDEEAHWARGQRCVVGSHNWVPEGTSDVPPEWTHTAFGTDPGVADLAKLDLRPTSSSSLLGQGTTLTSIAGVGFPGALPLPERHPPARVEGRLVSPPRPRVNPIAIGAFEYVPETTRYEPTLE